MTAPTTPRWKTLAASGAVAAAIAAALAGHWEGRVHTAYWDAVGQTWTICEGHTSGVHRGDTATDAQCDAFLRADMSEASAAVRRCITAPLTEWQRAAFIDAAYNVGPAVVCGSTLQRLANAGDLTGACLQLTDARDRRGNAKGWTSPGSAAEAGLRNRRTDDRNLCLGYFQ